MKRKDIALIVAVSVFFAFTGCMASSHTAHEGNNTSSHTTHGGSNTSQHSGGCH